VALAAMARSHTDFSRSTRDGKKQLVSRPPSFCSIAKHPAMTSLIGSLEQLYQWILLYLSRIASSNNSKMLSN
jgi:hypothetical protein